MAEALIRRRAERDGLALTVSSAGIMFDARPATPEAVDVMAQSGIDLSGHRSRIMDADMLRAADLVICMERLHAREAVVMAPEVFPRTFTLKELVRCGHIVGGRGQESLESWTAAMSSGRRPQDLLGESPEDDVADPYGRSTRVYAATAAELEGLVGRLVVLLRGAVPAERPA